MKLSKSKKILIFLVFLPFVISSCKGPDGFKLPGGDARKTPADPKKRVEQNLKEGRGFRFDDALKKRGGTFDFASSNELWRASLDIIDFMPLLSANYSGGIIITDWYSDGKNVGESIKISIRFLTNEIRSDALDINVYLKKCDNNSSNCSISKNNNDLVADLNLSILKRATKYQKEIIDKNKKENPYIIGDPKQGDSR